MTSASLVFHPVQDARHHAAADQFPDRARARRRIAVADALCAARAQAHDRGHRAACDLPRSRRSAICCSIRSRAAFRHGMPRAARPTASSCWADRSIPIFPPRTACRSSAARPTASSRPPRWRANIRTRSIVFSGGSASLISNEQREADYAAAHVRKPRRRQGAPDHGSALAQHLRECACSARSWPRRNPASAGCW